MLFFQFAQVLCDGLLMSVRAKLLLNVTTNFSYHYSHATMRDENQKHWACSCIFVNRQSWLQVLGLVLQIDDGSIYLSDLPTCIEITPYQLPKAKTTRKWLTRETFDKLQNIVWEKTSTAAVDPKHFKQGSCRLRFSCVNCSYVINRTCQYLMLIM